MLLKYIKQRNVHLYVEHLFGGTVANKLGLGWGSIETEGRDLVKW